MDTLRPVGLSAIGGAVCLFGITKITAEFWTGLVAIVVGAGIIVAAAFLNKKGIIVGKKSGEPVDKSEDSPL